MEVRQVRLVGLVALPPGVAPDANGQLHLPQGTFVVGPALYRVQPQEQVAATTVLQQQPAVVPALQYVPYEQWPAGLELDSSVLTDFSAPLNTRNRDLPNG